MTNQSARVARFVAFINLIKNKMESSDLSPAKKKLLPFLHAFIDVLLESARALEEELATSPKRFTPKGKETLALIKELDKCFGEATAAKQAPKEMPLSELIEALHVKRDANTLEPLESELMTRCEALIGAMFDFSKEVLATKARYPGSPTPSEAAMFEVICDFLACTREVLLENQDEKGQEHTP